MKAKTADKIATGFIYAISGIVALILFAMLSFILVRGVPHLSWHFLTSPARAFEAGGGVGVQLFNSFYLLIFKTLFYLYS